MVSKLPFNSGDAKLNPKEIYKSYCTKLLRTNKSVSSIFSFNYRLHNSGHCIQK